MGITLTQEQMKNQVENIIKIITPKLTKMRHSAEHSVFSSKTRHSAEYTFFTTKSKIN